MRFYLGTPQPVHLARTDVPLFVSRRSLVRYKTPPKARGAWILDSGGFTELSTYGRWTVTAEQYVDEVRRWRGEVGGLERAAPQDWMAEPWIVQKTGLSVAEHQRRTVENFLTLRRLAPELPFFPVIQGWRWEDYLRCVGMYKAAGVDLAAEPLVGVGSVCRRQQTGMAEDLMRELWGRGIRTHGFGFKLAGLRRAARYMASADSMAWSYQARRTKIPRPECKHRQCANCLRYALWWREKVLRAVDGASAVEQGLLF